MAKKVNILGALLIILTFFIEPLAGFGFLAGIVIKLFGGFVLLPILGINIAAYFTVYNNKTVPGMILTVLGGGIGGAIAVHHTGEEFPARKAVITVFQIEMWLLAWLLIGFLLYWFGYYEFSIFPH